MGVAAIIIAGFMVVAARKSLIQGREMKRKAESEIRKARKRDENKIEGYPLTAQLAKDMLSETLVLFHFDAKECYKCVYLQVRDSPLTNNGIPFNLIIEFGIM